MNSATSSAMLYTVEPPLSVAEFTSAAPSDLQVKIAVLLFVSCVVLLKYQYRFCNLCETVYNVLSTIALFRRYFTDCSLYTLMCRL
jgi:hypothetical protein